MGERRCATQCGGGSSAKALSKQAGKTRAGPPIQARGYGKWRTRQQLGCAGIEQRSSGAFSPESEPTHRQPQRRTPLQLMAVTGTAALTPATWKLLDPHARSCGPVLFLRPTDRRSAAACLLEMARLALAQPRTPTASGETAVKLRVVKLYTDRPHAVRLRAVNWAVCWHVAHRCSVVRGGLEGQCRWCVIVVFIYARDELAGSAAQSRRCNCNHLFVRSLSLHRRHTSHHQLAATSRLGMILSHFTTVQDALDARRTREHGSFPEHRDQALRGSYMYGLQRARRWRRSVSLGIECAQIPFRNCTRFYLPRCEGVHPISRVQSKSGDCSKGS